jgi:hypothetical protein
MGRPHREMEGDANQRRKAAREARAKGELPSARSATLGASKQRKEASSQDDHSERLARRREGKPTSGTSGKPRPGNRDRDPKRERDWR